GDVATLEVNADGVTAIDLVNGVLVRSRQTQLGSCVTLCPSTREFTNQGMSTGFFGAEHHAVIKQLVDKLRVLRVWPANWLTQHGAEGIDERIEGGTCFFITGDREDLGDNSWQGFDSHAWDELIARFRQGHCARGDGQTSNSGCHCSDSLSFLRAEVGRALLVHATLCNGRQAR